MSTNVNRKIENRNAAMFLFVENCDLGFEFLVLVLLSDSLYPLCLPGSHDDVEPSHLSVRPILPCKQALQANEAITIKTGHVYFY